MRGIKNRRSLGETPPPDRYERDQPHTLISQSTESLLSSPPLEKNWTVSPRVAGQKSENTAYFVGGRGGHQMAACLATIVLAKYRASLTRGILCVLSSYGSLAVTGLLDIRSVVLRKCQARVSVSYVFINRVDEISRRVRQYQAPHTICCSRHVATFEVA